MTFSQTPENKMTYWGTMPIFKMWIWEMLFPAKVTGDQNGDGNIILRNNDMMTNDDEIVTSWQSCGSQTGH